MGIWSGIAIPPAQALNAVAGGAAERQLMLAARRQVVPLTYGEDRIGALLLNALPHAADPKLLIVQLLWGYAGEAVLELELNDQALPAGSSVTHYLGGQLSPDGELVAAMQAQGITYTATLFGYMYSVVKIPIRSFTGQLNFVGRIRGRKLYDRRKDSSAGGAGAHRLNDPSTWEWSDNGALALADWTSNSIYGAGRPVLWSSVPAAANAADVLVGSGTPEKRRRIGLTLREASEVRVLSEAFRAYAGCWTIATAGGVKLMPDADAAPVDDITHEGGDLLSMSDLLIRDIGMAPTAVEVIYTDTTKKPYRDASAIAMLDGAGTTRPYRLSQVRLPGVQRYSQAMREAIERLNKLTLGDMTVTVEVADKGIVYQQADIIRLSHPVGLTLKPMRILDIAMTTHGRYRLQLQEHDPAVYSDTVQTQPSVPDTSLNNPAGPPAQVTGVSAAVSKLLITLKRTPTTDVAFSYTAWEYSTNGGGTYTAIPATPINDGRAGSAWQTSIQGALRIRARDVDVDGLAGPWSLAYDFTVGPEIDPDAGGSATLGIKINQAEFSAAPGSNYNEAYIHGRDNSGAPADIPGTIKVNGAVVAVPNGPMYGGTGPASGVIVWDNGGAGFATTVPSTRPYAIARKYNGQWQYDNNSGWVNFSPAATHLVIGQIDVGAMDTGAPGSPPGILAAVMFGDAQLLSSITGDTVGANPGDALNQDPYVLDQSKWDLSAGLTFASGSSLQGVKGPTYIWSQTYGGERFAFDKKRIPVDPTRTYNLSANLFAGAGNNRNMFLIVRMFRADGREYGGIDLGWPSGLPSWGGTYAGYTYGGGPPAGQWTICGSDFGGGGSHPMPSDVSEIQIGVWFHYQEGSSTVDQAAQFVRLTDVTAARAAGLTAVWTGVANRPKAFTVRSRGLSSITTGAPSGFWSGVFDVDSGVMIVGGTRSYVVVVFNRDGSVFFTQFYDVYGGGAAAGGRGAAHMAADLNYIASAPEYRNKILAVLGDDEPYSNRTPALIAAMKLNGASSGIFERRVLTHGAYVLIALCGCGEGNGAENYGGEIHDDADGWCELTFELQNGAFRVSGDRAGARSVYDLGYLGSNDATTNKSYEQEGDPAVTPGGVVDGALWRVPSTGRKYQRISGAWRSYTEPGTIGADEVAPGAITQLVRGFLLGPVASFNDV